MTPSYAEGRLDRKTYLISPQQLVPVSIFELIPDVQELCDPMFPNVIRVLLGVVPCERCSERQETHGGGRQTQSRFGVLAVDNL